jgi:hypothetical protein
MMRSAVLLGFLAACASDSRPQLTGFVALETTARYGYALARFYDEPAPQPSTTSTIGPCEIEEGGAVSASDDADANTITVTGTHPDVMLVPDVHSHYMQYNQQTPLWSGGEPLTITANGGEVPAFTQHLDAPGPVTITAPVPDSPNPADELVVSSSQDLVMTWTGGLGTVQILIATEFPGSGVRVQCRFPASDGTGTIPQAALAAVDIGPADFAIGSIDDAEVIAGDWTVDVAAAFDATWPDGTDAIGTLQFQ